MRLSYRSGAYQHHGLGPDNGGSEKIAVESLVAAGKAQEKSKADARGPKCRQESGQGHGETGKKDCGQEVGAKGLGGCAAQC